MVQTVADLCREQHITVAELAERSGLDDGRVTAIALGRWTPSPAERQKIAAVFGVASRRNRLGTQNAHSTSLRPRPRLSVAWSAEPGSEPRSTPARFALLPYVTLLAGNSNSSARRRSMDTSVSCPSGCQSSLSGVALFFASWAAWMLLPHHKPEWNGLPNEDAVMSALRATTCRPANTCFPYAASPKDMEERRIQTPQTKPARAARSRSGKARPTWASTCSARCCSS